MGGGVGHGRDHRHGRRAAADDHHALARVVQVLGPLLRVHELAPEAVDARELRRVAAVVVVVAAAQEHEVRRHLGRLAIALDLDRPAGVLARPAQAGHLVAVADLVLDPVLARGLAHVGQDRRAVGQGLGVGPGLEPVAQREHVRVRADARIAEQVPRAAHGVAGLEHGVALGRALLLQVAGGPDAGDARAHDQHVHVVHQPRPPSAQGISRESAIAAARQRMGVAPVLLAGDHVQERPPRRVAHHQHGVPLALLRADHRVGAAAREHDLAAHGPDHRHDGLAVARVRGAALVAVEAQQVEHDHR